VRTGLLDPRELLQPAARRLRRLARRTAAVPYRSMVVPLLGRAETAHAVELACRLAADRGGRVILVAPLVVEPELPLDADFSEEVAALQARLDEAAKTAASYGVTVKRMLVRTRERALGHELAEVAGDYRAEVVVVGAPISSRRGFRRAFPAEVMSVLREAPCRVLVVTGPYAAGGEALSGAGFARILVPMKLGPIGEEMVAAAVKLARDGGSSVETLFVVRVPLELPLDAPLPEVEDHAAAALARAARLGVDAGVEVACRTVRARSIGDAIVRSARDEGADLIVLGSSPRWRRQSRFFSPTVDYVLRHAPAEVLVVAFPQGVLERPSA